MSNVDVNAKGLSGLLSKTLDDDHRGLWEFHQQFRRRRGRRLRVEQGHPPRVPRRRGFLPRATGSRPSPLLGCPWGFQVRQRRFHPTWAPTSTTRTIGSWRIKTRISRLSPPCSWARSGRMDAEDNGAVVEPPDEGFIRTLALGLRDNLKLQMFNFDMIRAWRRQRRVPRRGHQLLPRNREDARVQRHLLRFLTARQGDESVSAACVDRGGQRATPAILILTPNSKLF